MSPFDALISKAIESRQFSGAVLLISRLGRTKVHDSYGHAQTKTSNGFPLEKPVSMKRDHLFDVASITKMAVTATSIMYLISENQLKLSDKLTSFFPEFRNTDKEDITIRHLLSHTAGLWEWKPVYMHAKDPKEALVYIRDLPLRYSIGAARYYSDLGYMLLGMIIEYVVQNRLDKFFHRQILMELNLEKTFFLVPESVRSKCVATSIGNPFEQRMIDDESLGFHCEESSKDFPKWRDYLLQGEVNDANAFHVFGGVAGTAGLFASAFELDELLSLFPCSGTLYGQHLISESAVDPFLSMDDPKNVLGWDVWSDATRERIGRRTLIKTGFTGTAFFSWPEKKLQMTFLTNRQHNGLMPSGAYPDLTEIRVKLWEEAMRQFL